MELQSIVLFSPKTPWFLWNTTNCTSPLTYLITNSFPQYLASIWPLCAVPGSSFTETPRDKAHPQGPHVLGRCSNTVGRNFNKQEIFFLIIYLLSLHFELIKTESISSNPLLLVLLFPDLCLCSQFMWWPWIAWWLLSGPSSCTAGCLGCQHMFIYTHLLLWRPRSSHKKSSGSLPFCYLCQVYRATLLLPCHWEQKAT